MFMHSDPGQWPPPRAIQPRPSRSTDSPNPASTNGELISSTRTVGPDLGGERRKKRGRPTKEEAEERDRVLAAAAPPSIPPSNAFDKPPISSFTTKSGGSRYNPSMPPPEVPGKHRNNDTKQLSWELAVDFKDMVTLLTNVSEEEWARGANGKDPYFMPHVFDEVMTGEAQAEVVK